MTRKQAGIQPPGGPAAGETGPQRAWPAGDAAGGPGDGTAGPGGRTARSGRQPWRAVFFGLAAVAIVAGVAWALLDSRFFVVRNIQVTGTHLVSQADVRAAAGIRLGLPLVRVDGAAAARRVEQIRQVQSARVSTQWPDRMTISVTERTPVLAVPGAGGYQLIDKYGVAVEPAAAPPAGLPLLLVPAGTVVSALRGSPAVYAAAVIVRELPRSLARSLRAVQASSATDVSLTLRSGVTIVWGGTDRPAAKARELALLMRTHARHYDVSAPGTAVTSG